tara:strand:+ start:657 stop:1043 length:387 start_codon:yes stop_codon:yes gene_type:complete
VKSKLEDILFHYDWESEDVSNKEYTINQHYHMKRGDDKYPIISWDGKLEVLKEWIRNLEVKLMEEKGWEGGVIELHHMIDDVETIKVEDEDGEKKERLQSLIYYLNIVNGMLEEELNKQNPIRGKKIG